MAIAPPNHTRGSASTDDWITPAWLIQALGPFDLDPCASATQPWPCAAENYAPPANGLMLPWHGLVWCNPPYGREVAHWLRAMALHGNGIALTFARTETRAFFEHVWPVATALLFLQGRLTFCRPDGAWPRKGANSGGPSVLIAYGARAADRLHASCELGAYVELRARGVDALMPPPAWQQKEAACG